MTNLDGVSTALQLFNKTTLWNMHSLAYSGMIRMSSHLYLAYYWTRIRANVKRLVRSCDL